MFILSIDVGMKHLACCLFTIQNKEYLISKWCVIDLCNEEKHKCMGVMKKNKQCTKNAKFTKDGKYYCKIHAKNKTFIVPSSKDNMNVIKKKKLSDIKAIFNNYGLLSESSKKMKKQDYLDIIEKHIKNTFFDRITGTLTKNISMPEFGISIKDKIYKEFKDFDIGLLLIENQIGPLALRMKTLQGMIMQHFIEHDVHNIKEISAHNKLKLFINKKTNYNERKKLSIEYTRKILEVNNENFSWLEFFNEHKKKDDLADCFLQGLWYFKENNLANIKINNI